MASAHRRACPAIGSPAARLFRRPLRSQRQVCRRSRSPGGSGAEPEDCGTGGRTGTGMSPRQSSRQPPGPGGFNWLQAPADRPPPCSRRRGSPQPGSSYESKPEPSSSRLPREALSARLAPAAPPAALWVLEEMGEKVSEAPEPVPHPGRSCRVLDSRPCGGCRVLARRFLGGVLLPGSETLSEEGVWLLPRAAAAAAAGWSSAGRRVGSCALGAGAWVSAPPPRPGRSRATRAPGQQRVQEEQDEEVSRLPHLDPSGPGCPATPALYPRTRVVGSAHWGMEREGTRCCAPCPG